MAAESSPKKEREFILVERVGFNLIKALLISAGIYFVTIFSLIKTTPPLFKVSIITKGKPCNDIENYQLSKSTASRIVAESYLHSMWQVAPDEAEERLLKSLSFKDDGNGNTLISASSDHSQFSADAISVWRDSALNWKSEYLLSENTTVQNQVVEIDSLFQEMGTLKKDLDQSYQGDRKNYSTIQKKFLATEARAEKVFLSLQEAGYEPLSKQEIVRDIFEPKNGDAVRYHTLIATMVSAVIFTGLFVFFLRRDLKRYNNIEIRGEERMNQKAQIDY